MLAFHSSVRLSLHVQAEHIQTESPDFENMSYSALHNIVRLCGDREVPQPK